MKLQEAVDIYYTTRKERDWTKIYEIIQPKLLFYLRNYIADNDTREELVARTMVKLWEKRDLYNSEWKYSTWAFRVALNETKIKWREDRDTVVTEEFPILSDEDDVNEEFDEALYARVLIEIDSMPSLYKEILTMRDIDRVPYEEIAQRLNININTVKTRIKRGRAKIKKKIENRI